ncbi:MAG: HPr family phosphocarrier protein [Deltaproteobacteria bacterium]|nr:HPr family phosphocarrier protein [Deltaproteobacteria bacterium]MBW2577926.1 HPr family phosphocarrier protein [Deltaproteobacteria bacterium]MBW2691730.1 HPr family phosphocarrier protein [Deltaproteobacteria bacterium]
MNKSVERGFTVRSELGLHARPAGEFVIMAGRFESEISVGNGREWVDGRSVLSLLSLAAGRGVELRVRAIGEDAEEAVSALGALIERSHAEIENSAAG